LCIALRQTKGKLISIEFSSNSHSQAKENVEKAGFKDICNLVNKNALEYIPMIPDNDFDFVFIDGMKRRTKDFFELVYPKIIS
jgi:predicted O-methyltransferase YrrM